MPKTDSPLSRRAQVLSLLAAIILCACGGGGTRGGAQFGSGYKRAPASAEIQAMEHQMGERLNRDRAKAGRSPLEYDEELADVARAHSLDMRDHHFFAHESPTTGTIEDRVSRAGYLALESRENLAEAASVDTAEDVLLASPGHYANIMAKTVTHIGIGIVKGGVKAPSNLTFTQVFAAPGEVESLDRATENILASLNRARRSAGLPTLERNPELDELASQHVDEMPREPSPRALERVGKAVTEQLAKRPIAGLGGVAVGGQLLWHSDQFAPSSAVARSNVRQLGLAVRRVEDERGRPQLKVLVLMGL